MRSWFTFIVTVILIFAVLVLLFVVNFVLTNRQMFEAKFNIIIPLQFIGWSHTWEGVQFMYIITGSILLGALIIALTTIGLDTKRTLTLRSLRKEIKRLQEALEKAQSLQEAQKPEVKEQLSKFEEESVAFTDSASVTPEEITKSFEDTIQKGDFLSEAQKRAAEEPGGDNIESSSVRTSVTEEAKNEIEEVEQQLPVEAELVGSAENSPEKREEEKEETLKQEEEEGKKTS